MIKFIIYLIRWQLSTPILAITMVLLANFNTWAATILANLIGGCIFFFVDRIIFEKLSSNKDKQKRD
jgi:bacteriorhodopsin